MEINETEGLEFMGYNLKEEMNKNMKNISKNQKGKFS